MTPPILPSPPTDNLYKFIAVAGLVLLFGAPVYWSSYTDASHGQRLEALRALLQKAATPDPRAAEEEVERHKKAYEFVQDALSKYDQWVKYLSLVAAVAGLLLAAVGFWLWYVRVQRPQDTLLQRQVEQAKSAST
jgi:hypothetical protein